ncbi:cache domain-containing protein [Candidatus Amarolinea aalborgensis]|uniref:cache domain-containing protein n=1 Tax=Candidatus Amarolinea aalborgensis TaxID=2249329 RepID=UPI003BF98FAF
MTSPSAPPAGTKLPHGLTDRLSSLRVQAVLWLLLPFALMLLVILAVSTLAYQQVVASLIIARDREIAAVAAERISERLENYADVLTVLSNDPGLRAEDAARRMTVLRGAAEQLAPFDGGVFVLDASGQAITNMAPAGITQAPVNLEPYFRSVRALQVPAFSDILDQPGQADSVMAVLVPISRPAGDAVGALVGVFQLKNQQLGSDIRRLRIGDKGVAYLVDRQGRAIYHPDAALLGQDLRGEAVVQQVLQGDQNALVADANGEQVVYGYASVAASGWGLITRESFATLTAPVRPYLGTALLVLALGLILGLFWLPLGARRITEPINRLASQAARLAAGAEVAHVDGGTIRELQTLAAAFDDMAQQVAASRAAQRSYVAAVTRTQEEERRRIARELHDGTVQALVAIGRRLEYLEGVAQDPELGSQLTTLRHQVGDAAAEVRRFSRELRPLVLEDLGLIPALRYLSNQLGEQDGIEVNLAVRGAVAGLDSDQELVLFRIFQETLTNISKHAQATAVNALVESDAEGVFLQVSDNGRGFNQPFSTNEFARRGHFGLMGIQERAQLLGGRLELESQPGKGTTVRVWLPV